MSDNALNNLIEWLEARHQKIMTCEQEANRLLNEGDKKGYRTKLRQKAELLQSMVKESRDLVALVPGDKRPQAEAALEKFSQGAATALQLDSPFYMSALLYPDNHHPGEPDDLRRFIDSLSRKGA